MIVSLFENLNYREIYDAIVIGLGPAGVAAFTSLHQNGFKVLPLEAGNRIGGRINSVPFGDCIIDLGAEWFISFQF